MLDVSQVTVAEAFYTLLCFYEVGRKEAAEKLSLPLQQHGVRLRDESQVPDALARLETANVGFADAFLAAGAEEENVAVASFDRDFDKMKIRRHEPTAKAGKIRSENGNSSCQGGPRPAKRSRSRVGIQTSDPTVR